MNDSDIEMAELAEAGNMAAAGVCSLCEDVLDATHPKWAGETWYWSKRLGRHMTAEEVNASNGPVDAQLGWHVYCMRDRGIS